MKRFISTIGEPPPASDSILVLTDSDDGRALAPLLRERGFSTRCAPASRLGRMFEASIPDLVVVEGTDLRATIALLRESTVHLPIIAISSKIIDALSAGADHAVAPPASLDEIAARAPWLIRTSRRYRAMVTRVDSVRLWQDWVRYLLHDLRHPLTTATAHVGLASVETPGDDLAIAERALDDLALMLRDILDTDRIRHGALTVVREDCDLVEIARAAANRVAGPIAVEVDSDGDTRLSGDHNLLRRVFANLFENARQHAERAIRVEITGGMHGVSASISNDGPGIAEDLQAHVFEPWQSYGGRSTGIGLAFCRIACEAHDGRIWLQSGDPGAVTFTFGIPRETKAP